MGSGAVCVSRRPRLDPPARQRRRSASLSGPGRDVRGPRFLRPGKGRGAPAAMGGGGVRSGDATGLCMDPPFGPRRNKEMPPRPMPARELPARPRRLVPFLTRRTSPARLPAALLDWTQLARLPRGIGPSAPYKKESGERGDGRPPPAR